MVQYMATGDGDGSDTRSIGVLKTLDGGKTWNTTGLIWQVSQGRRISKLLMNPENPAIILAAASSGIYRTTDEGATWTQVLSSGTKDLEFRPGDPDIVYASGTRFHKSVNGGASFTVSTALPTTARFAIAVSQADANVVYAIGTNQRDFQGFYRSSDGGNTFSTKSTSPNIMGYASNGSDVGGGQAFYNLALTLAFQAESGRYHPPHHAPYPLPSHSRGPEGRRIDGGQGGHDDQRGRAHRRSGLLADGKEAHEHPGGRVLSPQQSYQPAISRPGLPGPRPELFRHRLPYRAGGQLPLGLQGPRHFRLPHLRGNRYELRRAARMKTSRSDTKGRSWDIR
jgi:hypothetical protein